MIVEERYTLFKRMEKKTNKILEEKYRLLYEEINYAICDILRRSLLPKSMEGKGKSLSTNIQIKKKTLKR